MKNTEETVFIYGKDPDEANSAWMLLYQLGYDNTKILNVLAEHIDNKRANNRAENSHQPVRRRERKMQRFKSPGSAQRFLNVQSATYNNFYLQRHLLKRTFFKKYRIEAFGVWESASAEV